MDDDNDEDVETPNVPNDPPTQLAPRRESMLKLRLHIRAPRSNIHGPPADYPDEPGIGALPPSGLPQPPQPTQPTPPRPSPLSPPNVVVPNPIWNIFVALGAEIVWLQLLQ